MKFTASIAELVRQRRSCRRFLEQPLPDAVRDSLTAFFAEHRTGPFGGQVRFALVAATRQDRAALRGLGTYGFIDGAPAFIIGAIRSAPRDLEDFGYAMERAILRATDLGLATCWLGGTFTKSGFAKKIALAPGEVLPAVAACGYAADGSYARDRIRRLAGSNFRRPGRELFFDSSFAAPLSPPDAGDFAGPLELVRWAPSASNRQPWRIVRSRTGWHFYLARSKRYGRGTLLFSLLRLADLQRVDMGIAMCHFELAARELGLAGGWVSDDPGIATPHAEVTYTATWRPSRSEQERDNGGTGSRPPGNW